MHGRLQHVLSRLYHIYGAYNCKDAILCQMILWRLGNWCKPLNHFQSISLLISLNRSASKRPFNDFMSLWSDLTWDVVRRRLTNEFDLFMTNYLSKFPRNLALSEAVPHLPPLLNQDGGASTESLPFVHCLATSSSIISGVCSNGDPLIAHASYFGLVSKH